MPKGSLCKHAMPEDMLPLQPHSKGILHKLHLLLSRLLVLALRTLLLRLQHPEAQGKRVCYQEDGDQFAK